MNALSEWLYAERARRAQLSCSVFPEVEASYLVVLSAPSKIRGEKNFASGRSAVSLEAAIRDALRAWAEDISTIPESPE